MDIVDLKTGFKPSFQDFLCININNHRICFEKTINTYLKAKNSLHITRISSFKYVFTVFLKKSDAKIYVHFISNLVWLFGY